MIIKVKRIRSTICCSPKQRKVIAALGLRRMNMVKEFEDSAAVRGMIAKVPHMVEVVQ